MISITYKTKEIDPSTRAEKWVNNTVVRFSDISEFHGALTVNGILISPNQLMAFFSSNDSYERDGMKYDGRDISRISIRN